MVQFLSNIKQLVHDLIFGRVPPEKVNVMTVDISRAFEKLPEPVVTIPQKATPAIKTFQGERIVVLPFDDPKRFPEFTEVHKKIVFQYVLKRIVHAVRKNKKYVSLFQFGNSQHIMRLPETNFEGQLNTMLKYFVEIEDYETATVCRDAIRQIHNTM